MKESENYRTHQCNAKAGLVFSFTHQVLREANEFVWLMSDHSLIDSDIVFDMKRDRNRSLTWRIILPIGSKIDWQDLRAYAKDVHTRIEIGFSHKIIAGIALNEKVAGLLLPDPRGSLDFNSGFISSSLSFCYIWKRLSLHRWTIEIIENYSINHYFNNLIN